MPRLLMSLIFYILMSLVGFLDSFAVPRTDPVSNKNHKMSSFKSNESIHKKEDGSYYVVSANKASSVTL